MIASLVGLGPRRTPARRFPRRGRRRGRPCRAPPGARTRSSARRRPGLRARRGGDAPRPSCRRRCPASARRRSAGSGSGRATSPARPSADCRPRASRPGLSACRTSTAAWSAQSFAKRRSAPRGISPPRWMLSSDARAMLRSIEKSITSPCWRRSSGTSPTPAAIAAVGEPGGSDLPGDLDRTGVPAVDPEDRAGDLRATGADEPGERHDLSAANIERDVGEDPLASQPVDLQHDGSRLRRDLREERVHVTAHHRPDHGLRSSAPRRAWSERACRRASPSPAGRWRRSLRDGGR